MKSLRTICLPLAGPKCLALAAWLIWIPLPMVVCAHAQAPAQQPEPGSEAAPALAPVIPQQVRYAGKLANRAGETVEAVFRIYAAAQDGEPLWTETQRIAVAADGSYSVLLGGADPGGLPQAVFADGAARWLAVSVDGAAQSDRALLASVPYAMKSADAEALAGRPAAEFVTQEQLAALIAAQAAQAPAASPSPAIMPGTSGPLTGSGTAGNIPLWTGPLTEGNSEMVQVGSEIGINESAPAATLDVGGTENVHGVFTVEPTGMATTSSGYRSNLLELNASTWSTTAAAAVTPTFALYTNSVGNDTATPSAALEFWYQLGSSYGNILTLASNGVLTFSPAQTFPGTIKSVAATSPVTAATTSGAVTVGLSIPTLETTLNTVYPRLAAANAFTGNQSITGALTATGALSGASSAVTGLSSATGGFLSNGAVTAKPATVATGAAGVNSPLLELGASAYNSGTSAAVAQNFAWEALATGNDTASPAANLALLYGSGTTAPAATGLSISPKGNINWAAGQTFPITGTGGGTITGITTTSPLTGSGTSGSVALGLNTTALETTLNSVYAELGTTNAFAGEVYAQQATGSGYGAFVGVGTNGSIGAYGDSDTGNGVEGNSTSGAGVYGTSTSTGYGGYFVNNTTSSSSVYAENDAAGNPGLGVALKGYVPNSSSIAVLGKAAGDSSFGVYGEDVGGTDSYGVFGSTSGLGSTAIYGIAIGGADGNNVTGSGVIGISSTGNGVQGSTLGTSANGAELGPNGPWGLWGDIGNTGNAQLGAGILGTADNYSAAFLRNNGQSATLVANNSGQGPAASFNGYSTFQEFSTVSVNNSSTGGAAEMTNDSNNAVTLYLSNNGTGGVTDLVAKKMEPAKDALFKTLMASTPTGTCGIGGNGDLSCTGQVKSLVSTGSGTRKVETYAMQSPENWMEDFGSGVLQEGVAVVNIDPTFAETVSETADYHVFITPRADSKGLYVINATPTSFEVRESGGGTSSLSFDYRIVAKRRGYESVRHVDVTERYNEAMKAASMPRVRGGMDKPAGSLHAAPAPRPGPLALQEAPAHKLTSRPVHTEKPTVVHP